MTIVLNEPLSQISLLFVSAAMAFIALALVLFSLQLSKLLGQTPQERAKLSSLERIGFIVTAVGTLVLAIGVVMLLQLGMAFGNWAQADGAQALRVAPMIDGVDNTTAIGLLVYDQ